MVRKIVRWINYGLVACLAILALLAFFKLFQRGGTVPEESLQEASEPLDKVPKNSFEQPPAAYNTIGNPILTVVFTQPKLELPDLRPYLAYYGINDRPDIATTATVLHFGLKGSDSLASMAPGTPLYLKYDSSKRPGVYVFSADNQKTLLWIEATKDANKANITVKMVDEAGAPVTEPAQRASFVLTASPYTRVGGASWEIGKWKVDGTLLARQRARWLGQDVFLNRHGGDEYAEFKDKERIEFGEEKERYSIYVKVGDCLIWDGQRWQNVRLGESSRGFPLMCVSKIDDRVMTLDLWDVGGQGHVTLNLIKSKEAWTPKSLEQDFKFISTRTLSQYVFEIKKERTVLHPFDWLLLVDKTWVPLSTSEEIDNYVDRKSQGPLYVFQGPIQKEDKQVLKATLYSPGRTEVDEIEYPLDQPVLGGGFHAEQPESDGKKKTPPTEEPVTPSEEPATPPEDDSQNPENNSESSNEEPPIADRDFIGAKHPSSDNSSVVAEEAPKTEETKTMLPPQRILPTIPYEPKVETNKEIHTERDVLPIIDMEPIVMEDITDVIIRPKPKKRPGQLREDIRFLLQDNNQ